MSSGTASPTHADSGCPAVQNPGPVFRLSAMLNATTAAAAARAVDLTKTYGTGDVAVRALDGVNVEFERGRFTAVMGPSGSGKSTLMHCMAGLDMPTLGSRLHRRRRDRAARRRGADATAARPHRVRVPVVQPGPDAHGRRQHHAPGDLAGTPRRPGVVRLSRRPARDRGPVVAPTERAVRRTAATRRLRAGADRAAGADLRRRADRQPRLERLRGGARVPALRRSATTVSRS